ncbi:hypothetical protein [Mucilaginibacter antarcticus]|uniref:Fibronectin type-III domain-containing protein n=1 Tax=Mucilaginibacter antarcticus TaxID=1855725 RepID=A0ABW5XQ69_9SPHI
MRKYLIFIFIVLAVAGCKKKNKAVTSTIPGKPALTTPAQNSVCISGTIISATESQVLFTWNPAVNTDSYDLVLKNLLTYTSTTINTIDTKINATLLRNTPYEWYISAKQNSSSTTTQSDGWKFYNSGAGIVSYPPFPADIMYPAFGQVITPSNGKIELYWAGNSVGNNIASYTVCLGTTSNPPAIKNGLTESQLKDVAVTANTTYYWRIITFDADGNYTDSGLFQFKIQ